MSNVTWKSAAQEFEVDGSLRDIYVFDTDVDDWQRVLNELHRHYKLEYYRDGEPGEMPLAADAFVTASRAAQTLSIHLGGVKANAHFFTAEEIEFDIDPREIRGQEQLDAVFAFIRLISDFTGKEAVLTPENCRQIVVFRSRPGQLEIEYHPFGGWR